MKEDTQSDTPDSQPARPFLPTKLRIALWLGILVAVIIWCFPGEPMHDGLTLSEWLENPGVRSKSDEAIIQFGTNGIPFYLKMLEAEDSGFKTKLIKNLNQLPLVEIDPFTAIEKQEAAIWAIQTLGTNAQSAYPTLLNRLKQDDCHPGIYWALMSISLGNRIAPQIAYTHINPEVRLAAVQFQSWGGWDGSLMPPIEDILPLLQDPDSRIRRTCIVFLSKTATTNKSIRAELELRLTDKNANVREVATNVLNRISEIANPESSQLAPE